MRMKGTSAALTIKPEAPKVTLRAYVLHGTNITSFHAGKKLSVIVGKGESVAVAAVSSAPRSLKRSAGAGVTTEHQGRHADRKQHDDTEHAERR